MTMASDRAMKLAEALTNALCEGKLSCTNAPAMASFIDLHFPAPPPGREAEAAAKEIVRETLLGITDDSPVKPDSLPPHVVSGLEAETARIIASAYAPLLERYERALYSLVSDVRNFGSSSITLRPAITEAEATIAALDAAKGTT